MRSVQSIANELNRQFTNQQAWLLAEVIHEAHSELATKDDMADIKTAIHELAQAQGRTEQRVDGLAQRMDELAQSQKQTEDQMRELAQAMKDLARQVGGLARSSSYALENEAYRQLPAYLLAQHGIRITQRFIRTEVDGIEINLFAHGEREGKPVVVVGESKMQIDERRANYKEEAQLFEQLAQQREVAFEQYPNATPVSIIITHYARPAFIKRAEKAGHLVIQSYEW